MKGSQGCPQVYVKSVKSRVRRKVRPELPKSAWWILPVLPWRRAGTGSSSPHIAALSSFCWTLRAKRAEPWAFHHAHSCSEPRCGCPALGAAGRGCLRAREIPPDRASHSTTVFGISTIPHLHLSPPYYSMGASDLKKKKSKGKH